MPAEPDLLNDVGVLTQVFLSCIAGNDFSTLYAPLIRQGRMEQFYWKPNRTDLLAILTQMYKVRDRGRFVERVETTQTHKVRACGRNLIKQIGKAGHPDADVHRCAPVAHLWADLAGRELGTDVQSACL